MPNLGDLTHEDLYSTIAQLITGTAEVDGVLIDDVEHDDNGEQRRITLTITTA
jgi:hypothetical protein